MRKILVLAAALVGFAAQADVAAPVYGCQLRANVSGFSASPLISIVHITGRGTITCDAATGVAIRTETPVEISIGGLGVGVGYTEYKNIELTSAVIGVADVEGMIGRYSVGVSAGVTLIEKGITGGLYLKVSNNGLGFEIAASGNDVNGLEAAVQLRGMEIKRVQ